MDHTCAHMFFSFSTTCLSAKTNMQSATIKLFQKLKSMVYSKSSNYLGNVLNKLLEVGERKMPKIGGRVIGERQAWR